MSESTLNRISSSEDENPLLDSAEPKSASDSLEQKEDSATETESDPVNSPSESCEDVSPVEVWGLSSGDRRFLFASCSVIVVLVIANLIRLSWYDRNALVLVRPEDKFQLYQIDINRATWVEWMQVPEIGQVLAMKVVADRDERGPFRSVDDVERVNGIGRKTLDKIRPHLIFRE